MNNTATFVNAVVDVRVEHGVFHFTLGEMLLNKSGKPEFIPAFRAVLPADEAEGLFSFMSTKAHEAKSFSPSLEKTDKGLSTLSEGPDLIVKRKKIVTSSTSNENE
jgi:hypothetical protein